MGYLQFLWPVPKLLVARAVMAVLLVGLLALVVEQQPAAVQSEADNHHQQRVPESV